MVRGEVLDKVVYLVNDTLSLPDDTQITEDTDLKALGADSFDLLELVVALEDEFSLTMDDDAVAQISTVGQVVDAIMAAAD